MLNPVKALSFKENTPSSNTRVLQIGTESLVKGKAQGSADQCKDRQGGVCLTPHPSKSKSSLGYIVKPQMTQKSNKNFVFLFKLFPSGLKDKCTK